MLELTHAEHLDMYLVHIKRPVNVAAIVPAAVIAKGPSAPALLLSLLLHPASIPARWNYLQLLEITILSDASGHLLMLPFGKPFHSISFLLLL